MIDDLPLIEWPEKSDEDFEIIIINQIIKLLESEAKKRFNFEQYFFLISPHPAYNIDKLSDKLNKAELYNKTKDKYTSIQYGYKNRGWGLIFNNILSLKFLLPIFFLHGAENLVVAAVKGDYSKQAESGTLHKLVQEIVLGGKQNISTSGYVGLLFECNRLVDIFD